MSAPDRLNPQPWMAAEETRAVIAALSAAGAEVRFVGGCVRDALAGRPVKDIDLATPDPPDRVLELLAAASIKAVPTGIDHGTVTAVVAPRHFEVTTLRIDAETDGRRARVEFAADWASDAARRDFTINAIYCDADGRLFDPTGGIGDLKANVVRFVGDPATRINEDFLRILRFFRFTAHYGALPPDAEGLTTCRDNARSLPTLSGERVAGEVLGLLEAADAAPVLALMAENGILREILPEATDFGRLAGLIAIDGDDPLALRRLAAALATNNAGVHALSDRLRLSNAERERLVAMATLSPEVSADLNARQRRRVLYRLGATLFADLVYLAWAVEPGRQRAWRRHLRAAVTWSPPSSPVRGTDVLALGVAHGPDVGRVLKEVERWWIAGDFKADRDGCLERLRTVAMAKAVSGDED